MKMVPTWSFDWHVFQSYQYDWKNWVKFIFANTFTFLIGYMISVCIINVINKSIIPYLVIWNRFSMSTVPSKLDSSPHVDSSLNITWTWSRKLKAQLKLNLIILCNMPYYWDSKIQFQYATDELLVPENESLNVYSCLQKCNPFMNMPWSHSSWIISMISSKRYRGALASLQAWPRHIYWHSSTVN